MTTVLDLRTTPSNIDRIGYDNLLRQGTITASDGTGSYAADWRQNTTWEPNSLTPTLEVNLSAAATCNYVFIWGHNLGTAGATIVMKDGGTNSFTPQAVSDDDAIFITYDDKSSAIHQLAITATNANPVISIVSFGAVTLLEETLKPGWVPPGFGDNPEIIDSLSEQGILIDRQILTRPDKSRLTLNHISRSWMRSTWKDFRAHAIRRSWGIATGPNSSDADAALCWTDGTPPGDQISANDEHSINWPIFLRHGRTVAAGETLQESAGFQTGTQALINGKRERQALIDQKANNSQQHTPGT